MNVVKVLGFTVIRQCVKDTRMLTCAKNDLGNYGQACQKLAAFVASEHRELSSLNKKFDTWPVDEQKVQQVKTGTQETYFGKGIMGLLALNDQTYHNGSSLRAGDLLVWNADAINARALFPMNKTDNTWLGLFVPFSFEPTSASDKHNRQLIAQLETSVTQCDMTWQPDVSNNQLLTAWISVTGGPMDYAPFLLESTDRMLDLNYYVEFVTLRLMCIAVLLHRVRYNEMLSKQLMFGYNHIVQHESFKNKMTAEVRQLLNAFNEGCQEFFTYSDISSVLEKTGQVIMSGVPAIKYNCADKYYIQLQN